MTMVTNMPCAEVCVYQTFGGYCGLTACVRKAPGQHVIRTSEYVPVVRCGNCEYGSWDDKGLFCEWFDSYNPVGHGLNGYCSLGKWKGYEREGL